MKEPKDKRTKAWKVWKEQYGLGDLVEDITKATGIKKVVEAITDDCGCDERKKKLNKVNLFKRHKVVRCLENEQLEKYRYFKQSRKINTWTTEQIELLVVLYAHAFAIKYNAKNICRNCAGSGKILQSIEDKLDKLIEEQK